MHADAGWQKLFHDNPKIGFLAAAKKFSDAHAAGQILAPAKTLEDMHRVITNNHVDAGLCALFMLVVVSTWHSACAPRGARRNDRPTAQKTPYVRLGAAKP